jgi:hypothetical protein
MRLHEPVDLRSERAPLRTEDRRRQWVCAECGQVVPCTPVRPANPLIRGLASSCPSRRPQTGTLALRMCGDGSSPLSAAGGYFKFVDALLKQPAPTRSRNVRAGTRGHLARGTSLLGELLAGAGARSGP